MRRVRGSEAGRDERRRGNVAESRVKSIEYELWDIHHCLITHIHTHTHILQHVRTCVIGLGWIDAMTPKSSQTRSKMYLLIHTWSPPAIPTHGPTWVVKKRVEWKWSGVMSGVERSGLEVEWWVVKKRVEWWRNKYINMCIHVCIYVSTCARTWYSHWPGMTSALMPLIGI